MTVGATPASPDVPETDGLTRAERRARRDPTSGLPPLEGFRPDVQALRGIAVLIVVLFHAEWLLPGGYVGVDVFFVISGFVIGRGLLRGLGRGEGVGYRSFYTRRARRLLPALSALLFVVVLTSPLLAPLAARSTATKTGIAADLFSANLYLFRATASGYFTSAATLNPLLHTWSLSVEEQFYFVLPSILLLGWLIGARRARSLTSTRVTIAVVVAGSFLLSLVASSGNATAQRFAFYSPFTRTWEFGLGIALTLLPLRWYPSVLVRRGMVVVGVIAILGAARVFTEATTFPGIAALVPVLGAALVVAGGTAREPRPAPATPHPTIRPLIWLGDISYSWYLWHWPIIVFAAAFWTRAATGLLVAAAAISLVPAVLSRRALEVGVQRRSSDGSRSVLRLVGVCLALPLVAALLTVPINTLLDRTESPLQKRLDALAAQKSLAQANGCLTAETVTAARLDRCTWGPAEGTTRVAVVGDSNAAQLSDGFAEAVQSGDARVTFVTAPGCPTLDVEIVRGPDDLGRRCVEWFRTAQDVLLADPPDVVVLANANDWYTNPASGAVYVAATDETVASDRREAEIAASLARVAEAFRAAGSRVVVVETAPKPLVWDPRNCSRLAASVDPVRCVPSFRLASLPPLARGQEADRAAAQQSGAETWSFDEAVCPKGFCAAERDGEIVFRDQSHISAPTSRALAPVIADCLLGRASELASVTCPPPAG